MQPNPQKTILIVDDDAQMRSALAGAVQRLGYRAETGENGMEGLAKLEVPKHAMIVTDMRMPKMDGLAFLREVRRRAGNLPVLVITGFGTVENAVESMKEGATDYLVKPFSFDTLGAAIEAILARSASEKAFLSADPAMQRIVRIAADLAQNDITVLITGESGTGKELLARSVHNGSKRKDKPFVAVNCAAIPETLIESELFGHEKGSFTGAVERKKGKLELADSGTILLDEIGELPLGLQAKMLRVLQEREVDRIGGKAPVPVDVRVIATTNRDLGRECAEGRFRQDLYYRLNVFPLRIPPLRERPDDIPLLVDHFIKRFAPLAGKTVQSCDADALAVLRNKPWRGNVRELENVMQRALFLATGETITAADLMFDDEEARGPAKTGRLCDMERELILKTLEETQGNKAQAARLLGVSVRTVRNKLNEYGMDEAGQKMHVG